MHISYEDIGHESVTIPAGSCKAGQVCKVGADGKAAACAAGERFCGFTESIRGGCAGVQLHGFVRVPYTGTAPTPGYVSLSANGSGGVKTDTAGTAYLAVQVDSTAKTVMIEL